MNKGSVRGVLGLREATGLPVENARELCLHHPIEAQAEQTPDAIAVIYESSTLSYRELNLRANRLAHRLRACGVGPEVFVGVYLERSLELAVAVLAVLKAGGALLPLDQDLPAARLQKMIQETLPRVILVRRDTPLWLSENDTSVLSVDDTSNDANPQILDCLGTSPTADNLCAVFFTSGSTGEPKGVLLPHRVTCRILWAQVHAIPHGPSDRRLLTSSLNYASFLGEFCMPLFVGGALVLARPQGYQDIDYLLNTIATHQVTVIGFVPSVLELLAERIALDDAGLCQSLRHVFCHGEALPQALQRLLAKHLSAELHKFYGLTEAAVATYWNCGRADDPNRTIIGRPTDMEVYLLDDERQQVPAGTPGELYLGGDGMARGYLGQPDLTAERFVPNPFGPQSGARLFRTGDRGRLLPDSTIEFLGRVDDDVKLHGVRIDVHEIEAVLARHPAVDAVVVGLDRQESGQRRVVACVENNAAAEIGADELRRFLTEQLPHAMIPSVFLVTQALPRTANGKLDRRASMALVQEGAPAEREFRAPRTPVEATLAGIWADVLGRNPIGVFDNFFELGGDSMRAVQIVGRARLAGLAFTPRDMFEHDSIDKLAAVAVPASADRDSIAKRVGSEPVRFSQMAFAKHELQTLLPSLERSDGDRALCVEDIYPLSPLQLGMLFHVLKEPDEAWYFQQFTYRLRGPADHIIAHRRAWQQVLDRHSALRTAFFTGLREEPFQVAYQALSLPWEEHDLRRLPRDRQTDRMEMLRGQDRSRGFDLAQPPLLRLTVFQLADDEFQVLFSYHHLILDGWSAVILFDKELPALHAAQLLERAPSLPPGSNFGRYIEWLQRRDLARAETFWRRELSGFKVPSRIETPQPKQRGASAGEQDRAEARLQFSEASTSALFTFGRTLRLTLNTLVQGAWGILASRYSRSSDVVFGETVAGRPHDLPGAELLVGLLINTIPVRVIFDPDAPLGIWLSRLQVRHVEAREYDYTPLFQLQRWYDAPHDQPLFDSVLIVENLPHEDPSRKAANGLRLIDARGYERTHYPLIVHVIPGNSLTVRVEYDGRVFAADAIDRLLQHFRTVLESFRDPDQLVGALPFLPDAELHQVLDRWNDTSTGTPSLSGVHRLIEAQAERSPRAIAVAIADLELTYAELDERANQLANFLRSRGVGPETLVGLFIERSLDMVVAVLAVLKSGGAYLPLDPASPPQRLASMIEDAHASIVVTQSSLLNRLPADLAQERPIRAGAKIESILIDADWPSIAEQSKRPPNVPVDFECPAYVIYTSGSTGTPKGVVVRHGALTNLLVSMQVRFPIDHNDCWLAVTTLGFDIAALELYLPLISGARLVIAPRETVMDPHMLARAIECSGATIMQATPTLWQTLLSRGDQTPESSGLDNLRILVGGEALTGELSQKLLGRSRSLDNLYGPTETTIWSVAHAIDENDISSPPIGQPIRNTQAYVLDARLNPAPVGVIGELYLAGSGLARGYLRRFAQTAERFVANPHGPAGSRMYRTGDLARWLPDGNLEFIGRADEQIKLRGFRVEPGEIEAVLRRHAGVAQAVVVARDYGVNDKRLDAYVVPDRASVPTPQELRRNLEESLPIYMVPATITFLESMPLNSSGKIDRRALAELKPTASVESDSRRSHPQITEGVQDQLKSIWASLFKIPHVNAHDDFFSLGGHSLLALRLLNQIELIFNVRLPLNSIFQFPTIDKLSGYIRKSMDATESYNKPALFCIDHGLELARHLGWEQPVYQVQLVPEAVSKFSSIEALAASYVGEISGIL